MKNATWTDVAYHLITLIAGWVSRHYAYQAYWKVKGKPERRKR